MFISMKLYIIDDVAEMQEHDMTEENIAHIQRLTALSKTNRFIASQVITLVFCMLKYINIEYQSHFHPNSSYRYDENQRITK